MSGPAAASSRSAATALAAASAVALAGCGGDGERERAIPWRSASQVGPRVLEVRYRIPGGTRLERVAVEPATGRVVVTLRASVPNDGETTLRLEERCTRIELERPLGNRALIDGATDATRRPVRAAPLGHDGCPPR